MNRQDKAHSEGMERVKLTRYPNGGWVVSAPRREFEIEDSIGAYSNRADLLAALPGILVEG